MKKDSLVDLSIDMPMTRNCVSDIRAIIAEARQSVVRHVNNTMTLAYWLIGRRLVVEEQKGKRAAYGEHLLQHVSRELTAEFGKGFAEPQLRNCRLFCRFSFPCGHLSAIGGANRAVWRSKTGTATLF